MILEDSSPSLTKESKRILFLEDDLDTHILIITLLEIYGYQVTAVETVADAQAAIRKEEFGLLLFDGHGLELCRQIRRADSQTPILFLSGRAFQPDIDEAMMAGAQAYLVKPVDLDELVDTVR